MKSYNLVNYNNAIKLKSRGLGSLRISRLLNIPRSTIEGWINQGRKPYYFSDKRIKACNSKENIERLRKLSKKSQPLAVERAREVNTKLIKNTKFTNDLAYILGVLAGDGHVSQRRIILSAIDKDFVANFKKKLESWSRYKTRFYSRYIKTDDKVKRRKIQWVCYLDSVEIERFIKNFDYKYIMNNNSKISFIKGFFDSEGSFSKDYELIAYNKDYEKLKLISNFLFDLGLSNQIKSYTVKNINGIDINYHYLKVLGKARYMFYHKIGFSIQRKQKRLMIWTRNIGSRKYKEGLKNGRTNNR